MEGLLLPADQLSPDGRLRDHLTGIPEARLLAILGVDYVVTDKNHDAWINNVYYDLSLTEHVDDTLLLTPDRPTIAGAIGLVSRIEGVTSIAPTQTSLRWQSPTLKARLRWCLCWPASRPRCRTTVNPDSGEHPD